MLADGLSRSGWVGVYKTGYRLDHGLIRNVLTLLDQPYFSRTWIIPEILQARGLTFVYGSRTCSASELLQALRLMFLSGWKDDIEKIVKIKYVLEGQDEAPHAAHSQSSQCSTFLGALRLLHGTHCADIREKIFAAFSSPCITVRMRRPPFSPDYRVSRDELVVLVIAYAEKLERVSRDLEELSRTLARSLMLGDGTNQTELYVCDVAASVQSCTRPWSEGESLAFKSGNEVGPPGQFLRYFLSLSPKATIARSATTT